MTLRFLRSGHAALEARTHWWNGRSCAHDLATIRSAITPSPHLVRVHRHPACAPVLTSMNRLSLPRLELNRNSTFRSLLRLPLSLPTRC